MEEEQYLNLIRQVIDTGAVRPDRTGTGTLSIFAPPSFRFTLANNTLPLLTTKRTFLRGIVEELLWFVRGSSNHSFGEGRQDRGRKRLQLEGVFGKQRPGASKRGRPGTGLWRHFDAKYVDCEKEYKDEGLDQLKECIKNDPTDRRIILSAWNPAGKFFISTIRFCQFYVHLPPASTPTAKPKLACLMYQRSADLGLGVPFNIASYALLTHMIAEVTETEAHELIIQLGDAHVYRDHVEALEVQLQ